MTGFITELGYMGFEVSDLPRWDHFASQVLGLGVRAGPLNANGKATQFLRMDEAKYRFILIEGPADDYAFAGWRVADENAVKAFSSHLDELGLSWAWGSDDEVGLRDVDCMLHFTDPEGNRHEIYCGGALADAPYESAQVPSGFVTGEGGLGHVVFEATNYAAMVEFGQKVLGLKVSDHIAPEFIPGVKIEIAFMHANERHHSFAVAPRAPVPGPHKRIHHFMLETHSMSEVGLARDRCLAAGQAVIMDIGQHPNDKMISFYGQTPSGFNVEFGYGGVMIDDATWEVGRYDRISEWGHRPVPSVQPAITSATEGTHS